MNATSQQIIQRTKNWIDEIVIGLNLCPFAAKVVREDSLDYRIIDGASSEQHLHALADCFSGLTQTPGIETSLLVFPEAYKTFDDYLQFLLLANLLLEDLDYLGIYQIASFHPDYRFESTPADDASNYTNRSPYPMLHILRERSVELAIDSYENIDEVPGNNIKKLRAIGSEKMQRTLSNIVNT